MSYREDLILAAVRAFARRGPEGTTVSDIANEAGVSQPRISQVFGSKEHAWTAAFTWSTGVIVEEMAQQIDLQVDPAQAWANARLRYPEAMMVLLHCLSSSGHFPTMRASMRQTLGEIVALAHDNGLVVEDVLRDGLLACMELSLGVQSCAELLPVR